MPAQQEEGLFSVSVLGLDDNHYIIEAGGGQALTVDRDSFPCPVLIIRQVSDL